MEDIIMLTEAELRARILPVVVSIRDRLRTTLAALNTAHVMRGIPAGERFRLLQQARVEGRAEAWRYKAVVENVAGDAARVIASLLTEIDGGRDDAAEKADFIKRHGKAAYLDHARAERERSAGAVAAAAQGMIRSYEQTRKRTAAPRAYFTDSAA
jgi:hypothetical protein